jgi:hypothetical protein
VSEPLHRPTTELVAQGWLRLAVPDAGVGDAVPAADDDPAAVQVMRDVGFIRTGAVGGSPNPYVPMRQPVISAECFVAPPTEASRKVRWNRAAHLADRLVMATYDPALMGVVIDLSAIGPYGKARVHTVVALSEPERVEDDEDNYARYDLDLEFLWTWIEGA